MACLLPRRHVKALQPLQDILSHLLALGEIDQWVREAGFDGRREVEIFSRRWWDEDQDKFLDRILESYDKVYRVK